MSDHSPHLTSFRLSAAILRRDNFIRSIAQQMTAIDTEDRIIAELVARPEVDAPTRAKAAEELERQDAELATAIIPTEEATFVG